MRIRMKGVKRDYSRYEHDVFIKSTVALNLFTSIFRGLNFKHVYSYEIGYIDMKNFQLLKEVVALIMHIDPDMADPENINKFQIHFYNADNFTITPMAFMWMASLPKNIYVNIYTGASYHQKRLTKRLKQQKILFAGRVEEKLEAIFVDGQ